MHPVRVQGELFISCLCKCIWCKIQLWPILPENTVGISNYTHGVLKGGYRGGHSALRRGFCAKTPNENTCFEHVRRTHSKCRNMKKCKITTELKNMLVTLARL